MRLSHIFTGVSALALIGVLAGCSTSNTAATPVKSMSNTTAVKSLPSNTATHDTSAHPPLLQAGDPSQIIDMKTGAYLSVASDGTFSLSSPGAPYKTIYGKLQKKSTSDGYVLTSVPDSIQFSTGLKTEKGNGTLTAAFTKKNGKWQGIATFKSKSYSITFQDNRKMPEFTPVAKQIKNDFLSKNYKDLYHHMDSAVTSQISYKKFLASMSGDFTINNIDLVGTPIVQGQFPLVTVQQQAKVTYTVKGKQQSKLDTWLFVLDGGHWMYEGSE